MIWNLYYIFNIIQIPNYQQILKSIIKNPLFYNKRGVLLLQSVKLDTQSLIAASNVSIQVMVGSPHWSVTVQKKIASFLLDVW